MPQTILVVDDEAIARRFMERALARKAISVMLANDGEAGAGAAAINPAQGRSGDHRSGHAGHGWPRLCAGGRPAPFTAAGALHLGLRKPQGEMAKRFLQKPFTVEELTAAVRTLITPKQGVGS